MSLKCHCWGLTIENIVVIGRKLSKGKCRILNLGMNNPLQQYSLGVSLLGSSTTKKGLEVSVAIKFIRSQQCAFLAKKVSGVLQAACDDTSQTLAPTDSKCVWQYPDSWRRKVRRTET